MKVQVQIANSNKAAANSTTIDATVGPTDTVLNVQELIASLTKTSFPNQKLLFNGQELPSNQRLCDCGVKDDAVLAFVFEASEETLVKQLSDLIGKQSTSPEELGLLYSYRHSVSIEDSLKALGYGNCKLRGFLESQKCFCFHGDRVKLVQPTEKVSQTSVGLSAIKEDKVHRAIEVSVSIEVHVAGKSPEVLSHDEDDDVYMRLEASETVARSMEIIAASEQMPFPDRDLWMGKQKLENELSLDEASVRNGSALVMVVRASEASLASQLEDLLWERVGLSPSELGLHYCQRFGTPIRQALRILGLHSNLGRFLEGHSQFSVKGGCVTLVKGPKLTTPMSQEERSNALAALDYVMELLGEASFLSIDHVKKECCAAGEATATIFVNGLSPSHEAPLVQGLQKTIASALKARRGDESSIDSVAILGDVVQVEVEGSQTVSIRLAAATQSLQ